MVTFLFSEKMSEIIKEGIKMENIENKEESLKEIFPSSTAVENTCTVFIKEEDVKVEITETKGTN